MKDIGSGLEMEYCLKLPMGAWGLCRVSAQFVGAILILMGNADHTAKTVDVTADSRL